MESIAAATVEVKELKEVDVKIKAKCPEKSCRKRLWTNSLRGVYCKHGHEIETPLVAQVKKGGAGPKWRRKGSGGAKKEKK